MKPLSRILAAIVCGCAFLSAMAMPYTFSRLDASDGLNDNQVQQILQLPDGRMVFTTRGNLNLYDGLRFHYIHRNDSDVYRLADYYGHYHVYVGKDEQLWIKAWGRVWCLDLRQERYLKHPEDVFRQLGLRDTVTDLFVDSEKELWLVTRRGVWDTQRKTYLPRVPDAGHLQDLDVDAGHVYLFNDRGEVLCHARRDGKILYRKAAYPEQEQWLYNHTSLVVKAPNGKFYQIRTGQSTQGLFEFTPQTRTWRTLLTTGLPLHTLIVPSSRTAYISSLNGIWLIDLAGGNVSFQSSLRTMDRGLWKADLNTIYQDRQQGIWLGTGNRGVLYAHPGRFKFASAATPEDLGITLPVEEAPYATDRNTSAIEGLTCNETYTDRKGRKWAGTPNGLYLFLPGKKQPRIFYTEDGLPNNFIHGITEDARGRIWIATSNGIARLTVSAHADTVSFANFGYEDGTLEGEYSNGQTRTLKDGRILMGGVDGWTLFHPDSVEIPVKHFKPLLIGVSLHGENLRVSPADSSSDTPLLTQAPPYVKHLEFNYRQNHIGFDFSALNYAWPTHTCYRYRLVQAADSTWHTLRPQQGGNLVDEKGNLHLSFPLLPPGHYRLQVMASTQDKVWDGPATEISFVIHAPWWRTGWAYAAYTLFAACLAGLAVYLYIRQTKRRILRRHKEDILLLRIQNLIERCNSYERQSATAPAPTSETPEAGEPPISADDYEFLNKAVALVEEHIGTAGYSVEQLSKDLCIERSGLYKKLNTLVDKSPSLFIRSIRLKRAADLISQGGLSMGEVAERVGFSSASYMGKCFQEEFGCKPSEYAKKTQEST